MGAAILVLNAIYTSVRIAKNNTFRDV